MYVLLQALLKALRFRFSWRFLFVTQLGRPILMEMSRHHLFPIFIEEFDGNHLLVIRGVLARLVVLAALNLGSFDTGILRLPLASPT